ncbi:hypothetical protein QN277_008170 [Acacia crassicarpa]|uniref:Transmembrane protein n=1 Tax=Acacia crassicarpa TaxID=499986 RepID=A0AAE1IQX9_9FABA|nr:hypothetical protein QN277_008170 [Acacia crassicarpa]
MSTTTTTKFFFLVLYLIVSLIISSDIAMAGRTIPPSAPSTVTRPLVLSETETYMKPELDHKQRVFHGKQVKSCLPKGSKRNSAPSRFVNYKALNSGDCSGVHSKTP